MATEKNITMKQFNGTDYDTLYPKTIASQIPDVYSKTEVLTTKTLSKYGLTVDKLPNDVFQQIKTLIDNVQASADGKARIQTGSYVGTGTYGASNPCSLTFDFEPQILFLCYYCIEEDKTRRHVLYCGTSIATRIMPHFNTMWILPPTGSSGPSLDGGINNINFNGNKVTWYVQDYFEDEGNAQRQFNSLPTKGTISTNGYIDYNYYFYLAIG